MKPFFSVIIPTYNRSHTILRSVHSVLNQSFENFELIIVDDGSDDNTLDLIKDLKLKVICKENGGVSSARNLGASKSLADWICFLDSDDEWLPNKLKVLHEKILKNKDYKFFHSNEIWIRNGVRVNAMKKHDKSNVDILVRSLDFCIISPSTSCIHKDLFNKYGGFDEDLPCCEDYDLWLKILLENEIYFINDYLINKYGGHEDQLSTSFIAIDYFKVKSLNSILLNYNPNNEQTQLMIKTLLEKSKLLLTGYTKHNNIKNYEEVFRIDKHWRIS